jgi:hypothetical protein
MVTFESDTLVIRQPYSGPEEYTLLMQALAAYVAYVNEEDTGINFEQRQALMRHLAALLPEPEQLRF